MKKFLFILLLGFSSLSNAQEAQSIQVDFGLIYPRSSSNGFTFHLEYDYPASSNLILYGYAGYSQWDRYNIVFETEITEKQKLPFHKIYIADDHVQIPFFAGAKYLIKRGKILSSFVNFEAGYTLLKFNAYDYYVSKDPDTGEVLEYYTDTASRKRKEKNIFGIGVGFGFIIPVMNKINLTAQYKINSSINSDDFSFFSARGTYSAFIIGAALKF